MWKLKEPLDRLFYIALIAIPSTYYEAKEDLSVKPNQEMMLYQDRNQECYNYS